MSEPNFIELAMREVHRASAEPNRPTSLEATAVAKAGVRRNATHPVTSGSALGREGPTHTLHAKEKKTSHDLAAMILEDLNKVEGCPKQGVNVTVYGSNPWNSWLSFGVDAGAVDAPALKAFCEIITERLKRLYDVPT